MEKYTVDAFLDIVKSERTNRMSPYELVYKNFIKLGYDKKTPDFFAHNASLVVEELREACWNSFLPEEEQFTADMLKLLIEDNKISQLSPTQAIQKFLDSYPTHIYRLCLSNTQSRRSRAGKEFEAIIELLLMGANVPMDSQGNIGKRIFTTQGIGKLVDFVSPGVLEYKLNKTYTVLVSAKTTLRERWQEVPEEMGRTGAREMYLATLDDTISDEVLVALYEANIIVTTTKNNKMANYRTDRRVFSFEALLENCISNARHWPPEEYTEEEKAELLNSIEKQMNKHRNHPFVISYYLRRKAELL